jgi:hypothetical protein
VSSSSPDQPCPSDSLPIFPGEGAVGTDEDTQSVVGSRGPDESDERELFLMGELRRRTKEVAVLQHFSASLRSIATRVTESRGGLPPFV